MSTYNIKNKEILKQSADNMPYSIPTQVHIHGIMHTS